MDSNLKRIGITTTVPSEVILASGLVAWLIQLLTRHNYQNLSSTPLPLYPFAPLLWPFLLFIGSVALSWLNTLSIGASLVETIKWVEMLLLYLLVTALLPARQTKWVVVTILLTGMAQAALGLYQFIFKVGPEGFLLFGGRFLRAYGTFAQPNPYAGYLGLILPLALALVVWGLIDFARPCVTSSSLLARVKNKSTIFLTEADELEGIGSLNCGIIYFPASNEIFRTPVPSLSPNSSGDRPIQKLRLDHATVTLMTLQDGSVNK